MHRFERDNIYNYNNNSLKLEFTMLPQSLITRCNIASDFIQK